MEKAPTNKNTRNVKAKYLRKICCVLIIYNDDVF